MMPGVLKALGGHVDPTPKLHVFHKQRVWDGDIRDVVRALTVQLEVRLEVRADVLVGVLIHE